MRETWLSVAPLCSKNEYTKSESDSQLPRIVKCPQRNCVQRTNIQNLKAIHNQPVADCRLLRLCSKNEYTKSESDSQLSIVFCLLFVIVFKERIYKI